MDSVLREHDEYAAAFIDDIIIYSDSFEDHLVHVRRIFELFESLNISLSPGKSFIGYPSIQLLGFRVDGLGLSNTNERIKAIRSVRFPNTLQQLERWLGMTGWLRHLIPHYAIRAASLQKLSHGLVQDGPVTWTRPP
jgi:hypothetical protein